jgi:MarR family 2-MHQ and catechol resistance regulon transcriptional repressor
MPTHYQGTEAETLAFDTFIKLMRCSDALNARLNPVLEADELTVSQFGVLEALYHLGPLTLSELARKILRSGGNLTLVARNLERDKLVKRLPNKDDKRVTRLELTPKGKSVAEKALRRHAENLVRQMSVLTSDEQAELGRLCKRLGIQKPTT